MHLFVSEKRLSKLVKQKLSDQVAKIEMDAAKAITEKLAREYSHRLRTFTSVEGFIIAISNYAPQLYDRINQKLEHQIRSLNSEILGRMIEEEVAKVESNLMEKIMEKQGKTMELVDAKFKSKDFIAGLIAEINKYQLKGKE